MHPAGWSRNPETALVHVKRVGAVRARFPGPIPLRADPSAAAGSRRKRL